MTINGVIPEETDPDARRYANLTGKETYWEGHLRQITIETSRKILREACSTFPDALLVKPVMSEAFKLERLETTSPERVDHWNVWLINGPSVLTEIDIDPEYGVMPKSDQLIVAINFSSWQYPAPKYTSQKRQAEEDLGRTFFVPGERSLPDDIALATDTLALGASFPKENQVTREALATLGETISQQLPTTKLERVDLATGKHIDYIDKPIDPVIINWCNSSADRWTAVIREQRNGPWIGVRPASQ